MPTLIVTAEVEDREAWENRFRSHSELLKRQGFGTPVRIGVAEANQICLLFEVDDLDSYLESLEWPETIAAQKGDGVDRESLQLFVIDSEVEL